MRHVEEKSDAAAEAGLLGTGTLLDDDTKFYVVDNATTNRTFEYGSGTGTAGENYSLNSGNATPRGAASTAAGDKVWVVDANRCRIETVSPDYSWRVATFARTW